jgi:hypothetical protein
MNVLRAATNTVFGIALIGATLLPAARADTWNKKTTVTFSGPVEIPGVHLTGWGVLPAGTYVFKLVSSDSNRHIVQIFNQSETKVYATILAIPNYRLKATDKTVITFRERPAGQPEALRAWFYPGMNSGEEFVYPKAKAIELAKVTNTPVLAIPAEIKLEVERPEEAQVVEQLKQVPVIAVKPTGEEVEIAEVVTPPPTETHEVEPVQVAQARTEPALPRTASPLPLMGLLGMLALGGAASLRFIQKRLR